MYVYLITKHAEFLINADKYQTVKKTKELSRLTTYRRLA